MSEQTNIADRWKPVYHFMPPQNWMNDPNGLLYFEGCYHLFYQHNPYNDTWGNIHWGHAKSNDLIHWEHCPIALHPSREKGEIHCYSGCAVNYKGTPTIFYTSIGENSRGPRTGAEQWCAASQDGMMTWKKAEKPVMVQAINGETIINMWRDPFVWKEDSYFALLGGTHEEKGCLALYKSLDLLQWEFINIIIESQDYSLLECPNMIPFHEKYLLLYSPLDAVRYCIGTLDKEKGSFTITQEGIFDHSIGKRGFYAPNTYLNAPGGRKIVIGWLSEMDRAELKWIKGWAGVQSLPREVWIEEDELRINPVKECGHLRKEHIFSLDNTKNVPYEQLKIAGRALEIILQMTCQAGGELQLHLFESPDGRENTVLRYECDSGIIVLDRRNSSLWTETDKTLIQAVLPLKYRNELELHIFIDHSTIEIFINESITITARVFPSLKNSDGVSLHHNIKAVPKLIDIFSMSLLGEGRGQMP